MTEQMMNRPMTIHDILHQDRVWVTRDGEVYVIDDMEVTHKANTVAYVLRNARGIALGSLPAWGTGYFDVPDDVAGDLMRHEDEVLRDPVEWMRTRPVIQRLLRDLLGESAETPALEPATVPRPDLCGVTDPEWRFTLAEPSGPCILQVRPSDGTHRGKHRDANNHTWRS